jgi:hypothetical protein
MLLGKKSLFIVRTIRNTQIHCVGRMHSSVIHTNSVRTSQETHYFSVTKPNRLILFRETLVICCENHAEHTNTLCGQNAEFCNIYKFSSYLTGNTLRPRYKAQPVNAVKETVAVYCENHTEYINTLWGQNIEFIFVKIGGAYSIHWALQLGMWKVLPWNRYGLSLMNKWTVLSFASLVPPSSAKRHVRVWDRVALPIGLSMYWLGTICDISKLHLIVNSGSIT